MLTAAPFAPDSVAILTSKWLILESFQIPGARSLTFFPQFPILPSNQMSCHQISLDQPFETALAPFPTLRTLLLARR